MKIGNNNDLMEHFDTFKANIGEKSPKNSVIMIFNRNLYLQKLIAADGNGMIKIIRYGRRAQMAKTSIKS